MSTTDNKFLIDKCSQGDAKAQMQLYDLYSKRIYICCYRVVGNAHEAEEAMQDSFLKIFTNINQYDREKNFEVWMHRIAVNTAIDYVRRQSQFEEELSDNISEPVEEAHENDYIDLTVSKIREGIQKLSPSYRLILSLYLFEGYDMEEISSILDIKPVTVRTQYMRGKRKLMELIKE